MAEEFDDSMLDFDKGWFVIQTYSGYEQKVKQNLLERIQIYNMQDDILRVEVPTQTVEREVNGKVKEVEENLYPGYVLVEMNMTDEAWFIVRNTPNVTGFVGSHGNRSKPTPLFDDEVEDIFRSVGKRVKEVAFDPYVGMPVRILEGAFAGFEGPISEIVGDKVKVNVDMFGRETAVEIDTTEVEPTNQ
jgi:transcriptional antiterminator NusG